MTAETASSPFQTTPRQQPQQEQPAATIYTVQWNGNGESRVSQYDRDEICDAVESGGARALFPLHGQYGAMSLGVDGFTLWLYAVGGGAFIAGEIVDKSSARPRAVPSSGTVDISSLAPEVQNAIMTLLRKG